MSTNRNQKLNILMTGATGFLGSNLLKALLEQQHNIVILKRSFSDTRRIDDVMDKVMFFNIDEIEVGEVFGKIEPEVILHCATNYGRNEIDPFLVIDANLLLPLKLLEMGKKSGVNCFINTDTILDKRINHYSLSKSQFKGWLEMYSESFVCINVLLEHFYGAFDDKTKFASFIIDKVLNNALEIDLTEGRQKRDFIYIDDVVDAFIKIIGNLENLKKGFYDYEIGTNEPVAIRDFVRLIKDISGNKSTKLNFGAIPYRKNEIMKSKVDTEAIRELGWSPKYSLEKGLRKTIEQEVRMRSK